MNRAKPLVIITIIFLSLIIVGVVAFQFGSSKSTKDKANNSNTSSTQDNTVKANTKNSYIAINQNLSSFPSAALNNTNIILLNISHNQITSLPSQIGQLTKLEDFNVSYNKLSGSLPGEIRKMSLKKLDASYNNLTGVPGEIGQQPNLKNINLSYNKLTGLPNELANIPVIDVLDLSYNSIDSVTDLSKYKNVTLLKLGGNKLTTAQISQLQAALPTTQITLN